MQELQKVDQYYTERIAKEKMGKGRGTVRGKGQTGQYLMQTMQRLLSSKKYRDHKDHFLGVFQQHDARLENALKNIKTPIFFWIQNTNDFDQRENKNDDYHWYAVFVDLHHMNMNVFDSSGYIDKDQYS